MTSVDDSNCSEVRDQQPAVAASNKPLVPFSIEDILNKPSVRRRSCCLSGVTNLFSPREKTLSTAHSVSRRMLLSHSSPLLALEELASRTFKNLEVSILQAAEGKHYCSDGVTLFSQKNTSKKRRKSRTAFTNHQIYELEKRFSYQKYLSPADRNQVAQHLGLSNTQVVTWFQNRRAKLKRDLEEMKADVESAKAAGTVAFEKLSKLAKLEKNVMGGMSQETLSTHKPDPVTSWSETLACSPTSSKYTEQLSSKVCSEDEEEINVND